MSKPSICIIHGAWHHPAYYQPLVDSLTGLGHETICPRLPSCSEGVSLENSFAEDVACIQSNVSKLVDAGKEVVVLMHSYGGVVGTEAISGFGIEERKAGGKVGGVKRLIYMTAFIPQKGQSLAGIFGGGLPPFIDVKDEENLLLIPDAARWFYNDLPPTEAAEWAKQIVVHPKPAQFTPISREAYRNENGEKTIPVSYIRCEQDAALIPSIQQMMIDALIASGIDVSVEKCEGSHSPFLSMPGIVAEIVSRVGVATA